METTVLIKMRDDAGLKGIVADRIERSGLALSMMVKCCRKRQKMYEIN